MSRKGNCWDNACAESFFKTLKGELETLDGSHSVAYNDIYLHKKITWSLRSGNRYFFT